MYLILTSGLIAFVLSLILTPVVRDTFARLGIVDRPDAVRKFHLHPIPRVGGIAIALSYLATLAVIILFPFSYAAEIDRAVPSIVRLVCAAAIVFATGLFDDLVGYYPWQKLAGQIWAAAIAYLGGVQMQVAAEHPWSVIWNLPLTILWIIGCTNAFNLIDGLDGLAAGVGLFATLTMLVAGLIDHNLHLALVTVPLAGCLVGFLRYNFNPASIFLGDCGSLLVGFLLGCYGLLWQQRSATLLGLTAPLLAVSIPVLDVMVAIIRRFLRHKPIFEADRAHIHHKLLARGFTVRRTALLLYGVCAVAAMLSLVVHALQNQVGGLIVLLFCVSAWIGIQHLGYTEFATARQLFTKGSFRRIIDTQSQLQEFETALVAAQERDDAWNTLVKAAKTFEFRSIRLYAGGVVREETLAPATCDMWEIRVPLGGTNFIEFRRSTSDEPAAYVASFVKIVQHVLRSQEPAAYDGLSLRAAAGAGTGIQTHYGCGPWEQETT